MNANATHATPVPEAALAAMEHRADPLADQTIADILGPWPPGDVDGVTLRRTRH